MQQRVRLSSTEACHRRRRLTTRNTQTVVPLFRLISLSEHLRVILVIKAGNYYSSTRSEIFSMEGCVEVLDDSVNFVKS